MKGKITCNKCGKIFNEWDEQEGFSFYGSLGYGMQKYDGAELELDLCCDCMEEIIDGCVVSPTESFSTSLSVRYTRYPR